MERSLEAQELIEQEGGFIEKWSIWIMLGILVLIGVGAGFIHYPDVVQVRARLTIRPGQYIAELYLPQEDLGKVSKGMPVQLRFDAYPYQEYGIIEGILDHISTAVSDSGCLATVSLNNGPVSTGHQQFVFKNGMTADAVIIARDASLLKRIRDGLLKRGAKR